MIPLIVLDTIDCCSSCDSEATVEVTSYDESEPAALKTLLDQAAEESTGER